MKKIFSFLACAALLLLPACSNDDDKILVQDLDVANLRQSDATYNSLAFQWDWVDGVNQYGYVLYDAANNPLEEGVTTLNTVSFSDLETDAKYNFELRAYGAAGETTFVHTLQAATLPIQQLPAPKPAAKQVGNSILLSWEPVEHAEYYEVQHVIGGNTFTQYVTENSCSVFGLAPGSHTLSVCAMSDYPGYTQSDFASANAVRTRTEIATVTGTYTCGLIRRNNSWDCTMHIYDDNSFVIDNFYDNDGYNLDFYGAYDENGNGFIGIYNFLEYPDAEYFLLDTGRESVPQVMLYTGLENSSFKMEGQGADSHGEVSFVAKFGSTQNSDTFVW